MEKGTTGEVRVHVDATPGELYDMVSDVTRMGEWSPETGRELSFVTHSIGPSTRWTYRFEPADGGGTTLSEQFEALDPPSKAITFVERRFMGITDRTADLEAGMLRTLERIKAMAESHNAP
jgi:hypothetical protein